MWDNVKKKIRAGQAKDANKAHACFMQDAYGYKHILRICYTYCCPTATVVARTRLNVTLHAQYIACLFLLYLNANNALDLKSW